MPKGLRRWYGGGDLHYITCSCYQRKPFLGSAPRRDLFLNIFEEVRQKYEFKVVGYVVMPEHIHLLVGEPGDGSIAVIMQVLKQRVSHQCLSRARSRLAQNTAPLLSALGLLVANCLRELRRATADNAPAP